MNEYRGEANYRTQSRADGYAFLAWLVNEVPDRDFILQLIAYEIQDKFTVLTSNSMAGTKMLQGLQMMRSSLDQGGSRSIDAICTALAVDHARLFRGISQEYGSPPPYESLYRSNEIRNESSILVQLAEYYRRGHVQLPAERSDRIDYLGFELDLMRLYCEAECTSWQQGDIEAAGEFSWLENSFLREHILKWVPRFCDSIIVQYRVGFYQGVAQLLLGFLEAEAAYENLQVLSDLDYNENCKIN